MERQAEEQRLVEVRRVVEEALARLEGAQCTLGGPWLIGATNALRGQTGTGPLPGPQAED